MSALFQFMFIICPFSYGQVGERKRASGGNMSRVVQRER